MASNLSMRRGAAKGIDILGTMNRSAITICPQCRVSLFSTTSSRFGKNSDRSKNRGVSAIRRTGPRWRTAVSDEPLPKPVLNPESKIKVQVNPKHGLWQFFDKGKNAFEVPENVSAHGRPWTVEELRHKSFQDLHCLWWTCIKERNRIGTQEYERRKCKAGFGDAEFEDRDEAVKITMRNIKHTLIERWYAYEDATKLARKDPRLQEVLDRKGTLPEYEEDSSEDLFETEQDGQREAEDPFEEEEEEEKKASQIPPEPPVPGSRIVQQP